VASGPPRVARCARVVACGCVRTHVVPTERERERERGDLRACRLCERIVSLVTCVCAYKDVDVFERREDIGRQAGRPKGTGRKKGTRFYTTGSTLWHIRSERESERFLEERRQRARARARGRDILQLIRLALTLGFASRCHGDFLSHG